MDKHHIERWLTSEHKHDDHTAEAAFAQLLASLPRREAPAAFVEQTALLATRARRRAVFVVRGARIAAAVCVGTLTLAAAYALTTYGGGVVGTAAAGMAAPLIAAPILFVMGGLEWWSVFAAPAATIANVVAKPQAQVALVSSELFCGFALYAIYRLLRMEYAEFTEPGESR